MVDRVVQGKRYRVLDVDSTQGSPYLRLFIGEVGTCKESRQMTALHALAHIIFDDPGLVQTHRDTANGNTGLYANEIEEVTNDGQ